MDDVSQKAVSVLIERIASVIDAKISQNNSFYVNNKFKNWKVSGSQISPNTISGTNIENGSLSTLKIQDFVAKCAQIAVAEIGSATIDTAQINNLEVYVANITHALIESADINWATIASLTATIASITMANIELATISYAQIESLTAGSLLFTKGIGSKLYIRDLAVTDANIVDLTVGKLVVAGLDGKLYQIIPDGMGGATSAEQIVSPDSLENNSIPALKIVADSINGRELNFAEIYADEATIGQIKAIHLDVGEIAASELTADIIKSRNIQADAIKTRHIEAGTITTNHLSSDVGKDLDLSSNTSITLKVKQVFDSSISASAVPPAEPTEGMLWVDTTTGDIKRYTWNEDDNEHVWVVTAGGELSEQMQGQVSGLLKALDDQSKDIAAAATAADEAGKASSKIKTDIESSISQLSNSVEAQFTTTNTHIDTVNGVTSERVEVIESHVKIEEGAKVTLSASDQATEMVLTPDGLAIQDKAGVTLADFTASGANVPRLAVTEQITLGNAVWVMHANGTSSIMGR